MGVICSYFFVNVTMRAALFCTSCWRFKRTLGNPYKIAVQTVVQVSGHKRVNNCLSRFTIQICTDLTDIS